MPEIVISSVDVERVEGRVELAQGGHVDVEVVFGKDGAASADCDVPSGGTVTVRVPAATPEMPAGEVLAAAARAAMAQEETL